MELQIRKNEDGDEGLYSENDVAFKFLDKETLKNRKYTLYTYVEEKDGKLYVKFGEAFKQSIFDRYNSTGHTAWQRMIKVWASEVRDTPIQTKLRQRSKNNIGFKSAPFSVLNTAEAYEIESVEGLLNFLKIIDEESQAESTEINKKEGKPYPDVVEFIDEVFRNDREFNLFSLCPRYSKTRATCEIIKRLNESQDYRIGIMCSYVGTVRTSYIDEINTNLRYQNIKFIDPDNYKNQDKVLKKEITKWLNADPKNAIMYYVAMTGQSNNNKNSADKKDDKEVEIDSNCFKRRIKVLKELNNFKLSIFVEEADFGCHCEKQASNIRNLYEDTKCSKFFGMTGTNAERILKIFSNCKCYVKDYMLDILPNRKNATHIAWHVLTNMLIAAVCGKNVMENWNDMLALDNNGKIKEALCIEKLFKFLFESGEARLGLNISSDDARTIRKASRNLIDREKATMVFVPNSIEIMDALKVLLEQTLGNNYLIKVIHGGETTNKDAERMAKDTIKDAKGRHVIFIASIMANRSFSVKEIKNIILLINSAEFGSLIQKIARGLTPLGEDGGICNIIDFRMSYGADCCLSDYLAGLGVCAIEGKLHGGNLNENDYVIEMMRSGKIIFDEYDANGVTPFKTLSNEELLVMMHGSPNFFQKKIGMILISNNDSIKEPERCDYNIVGSAFLNEYLNNKNIKGDQDKKHRISGLTNNKQKDEKQDNKELTSEEKKLQHWYFLVDFANLFISEYSKYSSDKLFNEITNMSEERKHAYEKGFGIDMDTMQDIVKVVHKDGFDLDILLNLKRPNKDKRLIIVKGNLPKATLDLLWDLLKFNEIKLEELVLLAFLGNTYFYDRLLTEGHQKELIYIIEEKEFECLYQDLQIAKDHIKFLDFKILMDQSKELKSQKENKKKSQEELFLELVEKESFDMNFNKVIMNPPFNKNLHLKILAKVIEKLDENGTCINLSPIRWLQDPLAKYKKNSDYKKFEDSICKHCKNLDIIDAGIANESFNIGLFVDLCIYTCDTCAGYSVYKDVYKTKLGDELSLFEKLIENFCLKKDSNNFKDKITYSNMQNGIFVKVNVLRGNTNNKISQYSIVSTAHAHPYINGKTEDGRTYSDCALVRKDCDDTKDQSVIQFNTINEAKNFVASVQTTFMLFCNHLTKQDQNMHPEALPWMGDCVNPRTGKKGYESEWTDKDFYKYFGITEDEQKLIEETMEKYK